RVLGCRLVLLDDRLVVLKGDLTSLARLSLGSDGRPRDIGRRWLGLRLFRGFCRFRSLGRIRWPRRIRRLRRLDDFGRFRRLAERGARIVVRRTVRTRDLNPERGTTTVLL